MVNLPADIWYIITGKLRQLRRPRDIVRLLLTSRQSNLGVSQSQRLYLKEEQAKEAFDKVFKDYDWTEKIQSYQLTPILIYGNKERTIVHLGLLQNNEERIIDPTRTMSTSYHPYNAMVPSLHQRPKRYIQYPVEMNGLEVYVGDLKHARYIAFWHDVDQFRALKDAGRELDAVVFGKGLARLKCNSQEAVYGRIEFQHLEAGKMQMDVQLLSDIGARAT